MAIVEAIPTLYEGAEELATEFAKFEPILQFLQDYWWLLPILAIWTLVWKGLALWTAAGHKSKGWFIALLLINTLGILDLIYYFVKRKK